MTAHLDEIRIFIGNDISDDEYEARRRIRSCRNAASFKAHRTESTIARKLSWMVAELGSAWVYAPSDAETLTEAATLLRRLLTCADQAEALEAVE